MTSMMSHGCHPRSRTDAHKIVWVMPTRLGGIQIHSPAPLSPSIEHCEVGFAGHQSRRFPAGKVPVHKKNDDRANHRTDQTGSFARSVPAEHLSEEAGYESANDAEDGGEDEPLRLIGSRHDELGDNARDKPDDDRPDDAHPALLHGLWVQVF